MLYISDYLGAKKAGLSAGLLLRDFSGKNVELTNQVPQENIINSLAQIPDHLTARP